MCKQTCNTQKILHSMEKFIKELGEGYWEAYIDNQDKYLEGDIIQVLDEVLPKYPNNITVEDIQSYRKKSQEEITLSRGELLLKGLGGKGNIVVVDNCYTRLRVTVADNELVDVNTLKNIEGVKNVVRLYHGKSVQIIVGQGVEDWRDELSEYLYD